MNKEILYIELKTGFSHNGPAWIGAVEFSKSKQTIYFDGKALKKFKTPAINANYYDIENGLIELTMEKQDKQGDAGGKAAVITGTSRLCVEIYTQPALFCYGVPGD